MNKQGILIGIALMLLFTGITLATSSATSDVIIYAFDQDPAGSDDSNEWVTFHNPSNNSVDIGNTYTPHYGWLNNNNESLILRNAEGDSVRAFCIENSITSSSISR
jgi:hypothetical protein